jgi:hypothetical protein
MDCGADGFPKQKQNKGEYTQELADRFKKLIVDAFDIGQNYSND